LQLIEDSVDFEQYLKDVEHNEKVLPASTFAEEVIERLYGEVLSSSPTMPWAKTHEHFQMRPGEVTLWAGINGHGKTLVTSHVVFGLMTQGKKACIASFEMSPAATMARMVKQASGNAKPDHAWINDFHTWTDNSLWLYDQQGTCNSDKLLGVIHYCADHLGVEHFVIDSLMKVVKGDDDYNGQKNFVDEVCAVARDKNIHVHLVAHVRKGQSEYDVPDKFDVKGSSSVTDQVDNVWLVWRNKKKEDKMRDPHTTNIEELMKQPDSMLICSKQRHGDWEGKVGLWLHHESMAFIETATSKPMQWNPPRIPKPARPLLPITDAGEVVEID
jgi:twinkle protein